MKKGFTVFKLIKLIVLLALSIAVTLFFVSKTIGNKRSKEYNSQINKIVDAAKIWSNNYSDLLPKNNLEAISIPIILLKQEELLPVDFSNPTTGEKFYDNMYIDIILKNNNYVYNVIEDSGTVYYDIDVAPIVLKDTFNYDRSNQLSVCNVIVFENKKINTSISFLNAIYNLDGTKSAVMYTYNGKNFRVERKAR